MIQPFESREGFPLTAELFVIGVRCGGVCHLLEGT